MLVKRRSSYEHFSFLLISYQFQTERFIRNNLHEHTENDVIFCMFAKFVGIIRSVLAAVQRQIASANWNLVQYLRKCFRVREPFTASNSITMIKIKSRRRDVSSNA